jgi:hypothetical protein
LSKKFKQSLGAALLLTGVLCRVEVTNSGVENLPAASPGGSEGGEDSFVDLLLKAADVDDKMEDGIAATVGGMKFTFKDIEQAIQDYEKLSKKTIDDDSKNAIMSMLLLKNIQDGMIEEAAAEEKISETKEVKEKIADYKRKFDMLVKDVVNNFYKEQRRKKLAAKIASDKTFDKEVAKLMNSERQVGLRFFIIDKAKLKNHETYNSVVNRIKNNQQFKAASLKYGLDIADKDGKGRKKGDVSTELPPILLSDLGMLFSGMFSAVKDRIESGSSKKDSIGSVSFGPKGNDRLMVFYVDKLDKASEDLARKKAFEEAIKKDEQEFNKALIAKVKKKKGGIKFSPKVSFKAYNKMMESKSKISGSDKS